MPKSRTYVFILIFLGSISFCLAQDDFTYESKDKRNPFIPLVGKDGRLMKLDKEEGKEPSDLSIDGIIYDEQGVSYALVNGRVVTVGDYAGVYRVLKIEKDKVSFIKDDQVREVSINREENN